MAPVAPALRRTGCSENARGHPQQRGGGGEKHREAHRPVRRVALDQKRPLEVRTEVNRVVHAHAEDDDRQDSARERPAAGPAGSARRASRSAQASGAKVSRTGTGQENRITAGGTTGPD